MAEMGLTGQEDMWELLVVEQDGRVSYGCSLGKEAGKEKKKLPGGEAGSFFELEEKKITAKNIA